MFDKNNTECENLELALEVLRDIAKFSYLVDGRVTHDFESGWNAAIEHIGEKARLFLQQVGADDFGD